MGDNVDSEWALILLPYALAILVSVWLVLRSLIKLIKNRHSPRNYRAERTALVLISIGLVMFFFFAISGGPSGGKAIQTNNGYLVPQIAAMLLLVGVVLTFISYPPFKKTPAEKATRVTWPWPRRHKILSLLAILIALVIAGTILENHDESTEKHNFAMARAAIDAVYDDTVAKIGPPDDSNRKNYCDASHEEFASPTYSCTVETDFIYGVPNLNSANLIRRKFQGLLAPQKFKSLYINPSISGDEATGKLEYLATDEYAYNDLGCNINYFFDSPDRLNLSIRSNSYKPLEIYFMCTSHARTHYYPVTD